MVNTNGNSHIKLCSAKAKQPYHPKWWPQCEHKQCFHA